MDADRLKWNDRYREQELLHGEAPSRFLAAQLPRIMDLTAGRRALDLACGEGRNSLFLARHGFAVTGVDIAEVALAKARNRAAREGLVIDLVAADLERYVFSSPYDLIINCNFLLRELFPTAVTALGPGGLLLVDTLFNAPGARSTHNPAYLAQPAELPLLFATLPGETIHYEERLSDAPPTVRLLFRKAAGSPGSNI
ncbi:MAG TPA: class I SAM-dependent methyltransferase [Geobacteraceae bacterium]